MYDRTERIYTAGARCSKVRVSTDEHSFIKTQPHPSCLTNRRVLTLAKAMNRPVGGEPAFRPDSVALQDPTRVFERDVDLDDGDGRGPVFDPTRRGDEQAARSRSYVVCLPRTGTAGAAALQEDGACG